jgi:hypothetical protein
MAMTKYDWLVKVSTPTGLVEKMVQLQQKMSAVIALFSTNRIA